MRQARRYLDLAPESFGAKRRSKVFMKNLDGYATPVTNVARKKDGGHATLPNLTLDIITIAKARPKFFEEFGHRRISADRTERRIRWRANARQRISILLYHPGASWNPKTQFLSGLWNGFA